MIEEEDEGEREREEKWKRERFALKTIELCVSRLSIIMYKQA